jgi:tRNA(fMet)-specific endonuclease VapC
MTTAGGLVLLDTSIVLHLVRGNEFAERIDMACSLRERPEKPLISVVTVGEAHAFAARRGWGEEKRRKLDELLREFVIVDIYYATVLHHYAEIDTYLKKNGKSVGDNDTWIAATTRSAAATLITSDKDFDPLHPQFISRIYFAPQAKSGKKK